MARTTAESRNGGYEQVKGTLRKRKSKISVRSTDQSVTTTVSSIPTRQPHKYPYRGRTIASTHGKTKVNINLRARGTHSCLVLSREIRKIQLDPTSFGMSKTKRTPRMRQ